MSNFSVRGTREFISFLYTQTRALWCVRNISTRLTCWSGNLQSPITQHDNVFRLLVDGKNACNIDQKPYDIAFPFFSSQFVTLHVVMLQFSP